LSLAETTRRSFQQPKGKNHGQGRRFVSIFAWGKSQWLGERNSHVKNLTLNFAEMKLTEQNLYPVLAARNQFLHEAF
jgi:hypothetical protein